MGSKMLYQVFETDKPISEIISVLSKSASFLGGQTSSYGNNIIQIVNGKKGIQFSFTADFNATITVNAKGADKYDVICQVNWKMNGLSWVCFVVGWFVFGILWIIPILSLFIDPSNVYNRVLMMASSQLEG